MKLSAQLVSILPAGKLGPLGSASKDGFAASMQSLMATFTGKPTVPVEQFPLTAPSPKPVLNGPTTAALSLNNEISEGKQHLVPEATANTATNAETSNRNGVITEGETIEQASNPQIYLRNSILPEGKSEQPSAQQLVPASQLKGAAILRSSTTNSADGLETPIIHSASHPQHKGHSIKEHDALPATRPGIQPALNTVIQGIIPVATQHTGGQGHEISVGKAQIESLNEELRLSGSPLVTPASFTNNGVGNWLQVRMEQIRQPLAPTMPASAHANPLASSNLNAGTASRSIQNLWDREVQGSGDHNVPAMETDVHVAKGGTKETITEVHSDTANQSNQNLHAMRAMHGSDDHDVLPSQVDSHALKEAESATITTAVAKAVVLENPPVHAVSSPVHESAVTVPLLSRTSHPMEAIAEAHHTQINAAQVLQKMDMALPSSAVQLRADARHLDIGVTSASLGWVEVRATASPSGRVDAALHVESNASAHVLTAESQEIAKYAREHSVQLGQISVGVGTGDGARGNARSTEEPAPNDERAPARRAVREGVSSDMRPTDGVSLISVRA